MLFHAMYTPIWRAGTRQVVPASKRFLVTLPKVARVGSKWPLVRPSSGQLHVRVPVILQLPRHYSDGLMTKGIVRSMEEAEAIFHTVQLAIDAAETDKRHIKVLVREHEEMEKEHLSSIHRELMNMVHKVADWTPSNLDSLQESSKTLIYAIPAFELQNNQWITKIDQAIQEAHARILDIRANEVDLGRAQNFLRLELTKHSRWYEEDETRLKADEAKKEEYAKAVGVISSQIESLKQKLGSLNRQWRSDMRYGGFPDFVMPHRIEKVESEIAANNSSLAYFEGAKNDLSADIKAVNDKRERARQMRAQLSEMIDRRTGFLQATEAGAASHELGVDELQRLRAAVESIHHDLSLQAAYAKSHHTSEADHHFYIELILNILLHAPNTAEWQPKWREVLAVLGQSEYIQQQQYRTDIVDEDPWAEDKWGSQNQVDLGELYTQVISRL